MTVIDWLLDADPSIRWQVMRDLTHEPADVIAAERARIATEGWGARLLALQAADGLWGGQAWSHEWTDTFHVLELLRRLGLDPGSEPARRAVGLVRQHVRWGDGARWENPWADNGSSTARSSRASTATLSRPARTSAWTRRRLSFGSSASSCATAAGTARSRTARPCRRSARQSMSWRACSRMRLRPAARPDVGEARRRGEAYLIERRLFRRKSTGEVSTPAGSASHSRTGTTTTSCAPSSYLRDAGHDPGDERIAEAIGVVADMRDPDGHWPLQIVHAGDAHFRWRLARARRADGTRSAPCACSTGSGTAGRRTGRGLPPRLVCVK